MSPSPMPYQRGQDADPGSLNPSAGSQSLAAHPHGVHASKARINRYAREPPMGRNSERLVCDLAAPDQRPPGRSDRPRGLWTPHTAMSSPLVLPVACRLRRQVQVERPSGRHPLKRLLQLPWRRAGRHGGVSVCGRASSEAICLSTAEVSRSPAATIAAKFHASTPSSPRIRQAASTSRSLTFPDHDSFRPGPSST